MIRPVSLSPSGCWFRHGRNPTGRNSP